MSIESLGAERLCVALGSIAKRMKEISEELRVLDAACGDGDLGITVSKGFSAIEERLGELEGESLSRIFRTLGMTFNNAAASSFGVFFATAFMHAGKAVEGKDSIGVEEFGQMLGAAAEGIAARGGAKVGDRTILDALLPASEAAKHVAGAGGGLREAAAAAAGAAEQGAESTKSLVPKTGRARWLGDKAVGTTDPGAACVAYFLGYCQDVLDELSAAEEKA